MIALHEATTTLTSTGSMCFNPLSPLAPTGNTFVVTNNFDPSSKQGVQSTATPWSASSPLLPAPLEMTLQGVVLGESGVAQVTNAVLLRVH